MEEINDNNDKYRMILRSPMRSLSRANNCSCSVKFKLFLSSLLF